MARGREKARATGEPAAATRTGSSRCCGRACLQRQLAQVLAQRLRRRVALARLGRLQIAVEEALGGGNRELKVESVEDHGLHGHDLVPLVRIVGDVDKLVDRGRVDLLVFRRDEHARDADQLQLAAGHWDDREEAINVVDGQVQRLGHEPVLLRHLDQPVDQDRSHLGVDVALVLRNRRHGGAAGGGGCV